MVTPLNFIALNILKSLNEKQKQQQQQQQQQNLN